MVLVIGIGGEMRGCGLLLLFDVYLCVFGILLSDGLFHFGVDSTGGQGRFFLLILLEMSGRMY